MKIVQVIPYFCFGGAETMCENLTYALKKLGHSVTVVCLLPERTPISERMERAGVRVRYLDKKLGLDLSMIQKLTKLFREEKPDVVHTHLNVLKYTAPAAKLAGVPRCVHTIHNVADKEAEGRVSGMISGFAFRKGWSIPVALSPLVHQSVMDYYGLKAEQIPTVFNGVPLNRCIPRETYALGEKAVLVHVGRFNEQKNHSGLLEAFRLLHAVEAQARLLCVAEIPIVGVRTLKLPLPSERGGVEIVVFRRLEDAGSGQVRLLPCRHGIAASVAVLVVADDEPVVNPTCGLQMHDTSVGVLVLEMEEPVFAVLRIYPCALVRAVHLRLALRQADILLVRTVGRL